VGAEVFHGECVAVPFSPLSVFWYEVQLVPIIGPEGVSGQRRLTGWRFGIVRRIFVVGV